MIQHGEPDRSTDADRLTVTVAVLTFRRPDDLDALLPLLVSQVAEALGDRGEVLVVDNDPGASAADTCGGRSQVRYVHEPRPGIAAARNRALDEAAERDVLVFIDDDERPTSGWLQHLLDTYQRTRAVAVVGPVISEFDAPVDPWIEAGEFFVRRRMPTGAPLSEAATNNLLLDLEQVRARNLRFDEQFGLSGGSDTLFTRQLVQSGARMVWCDEAVVTDVVPTARATRDWVLRRRLRFGNATSRVELQMARSAWTRRRTRVTLVGRGLARVAAGAAKLALGTLTRNLGQRAWGARTLARGAGMLMGAVGRTYVEYKRS